MSIRILVADDDALMRTFIVLSLRDLAQAAEVDDGDKALDALERNDFDLALIDWDMPGTDGLEIIKTVRAGGSRLPVVMVTAEAEREQVVRALKAGASDYLIKPFQSNSLREKLAKLCPQIAADSRSEDAKLKESE